MAKARENPLLRAALIICSLVFLVQGCGPRDSEIYAEPVVAPAAGSAPANYVGRWAASPAACADRPWVLTATHLAAPTGAQCDIVGPERTTAGFSANSLCQSAGAEPISGRLVLTLTGPGAGDSLSISEGPFGAAISLARCPA